MWASVWFSSMPNFMSIGRVITEIKKILRIRSDKDGNHWKIFSVRSVFAMRYEGNKEKHINLSLILSAEFYSKFFE